MDPLEARIPLTVGVPRDRSRATCVVTGAFGFTGAALVRALVARGWDVVASDVVPEVLARSRVASEAQYVQCDLRSSASVDALFAGCHGRVSAVFHTGALVPFNHVRAVGREELLDVNFHGTERVYDAAARAGARALVYVSSTGVVLTRRASHLSAWREGAPDALSLSTAGWQDAYSESKALAEISLYRRSQTALASGGAGLGTIALRPNGIWGAGPEGHHLPKILTMGQVGFSCAAVGTSGLTDWTHVVNLVYAMLLACDKLLQQERDASLSGRAFFVTDGWAAPIGGLASPVLAGLGFPPMLDFRLVREDTGAVVAAADDPDGGAERIAGGSGGSEGGGGGEGGVDWGRVAVDLTTPLVSVPRSLVWGSAAVLEFLAAAVAALSLGFWRPEPFLTRADVRKIYNDNYFCSEEAVRALGWRPLVLPAEGIHHTVLYLRAAGWDGRVSAPPLAVRILIPVGLLATLLLAVGLQAAPATADLLQQLIHVHPTRLLWAVLAGAAASHVVQGVLAFFLALYRKRFAFLWGLQTLLLGTPSTLLLVQSVAPQFILPARFFGIALFLLTSLATFFLLPNTLP
jgi:2-alkyl-3-oxoalkanoate reductase